MKTIKTYFAKYENKTTHSFNSINELLLFLKKEKINNYRIVKEELRTIRDMQGNF